MKNKFTPHHFITYFLALVAIGISIYAIQPSKEVDPTFIIEKNAQQILSKELLSKAPLKISKSNGKEINSNVYSQTFYFFNQGRETITKEKVLEPLYLSLSDTSSRILDFKILKSSRNVIGCTLKIDSSDTKLYIDFNLLEEDDGIAGQIIYTSDNAEIPTLILNGTVAGAPKGFSSSYNSQIGIVAIFMYIIIIIVVPIILALTIVQIVLLILKKTHIHNDEGSEKIPPQTLSDWYTSPYQLIIRNANNYAEKTSLSFTFLKVTMTSSAIFLVILVISLFLSSTMLAKWFDPRHNQKYEGTVLIPETLARPQPKK